MLKQAKGVPSRNRYLLIFHFIFMAFWFGGVMTWFPLVFGNKLNDFDTTYSTYNNMKAIAFIVIGWGGIGSFLTGLLNVIFTRWKLFKYKWVTIKFFTVIGLISFGMFFLEELMLDNIDLLEEYKSHVLNIPKFHSNHQRIKIGLVAEVFVFLFLISISVFKPWQNNSRTSV